MQVQRVFRYVRAFADLPKGTVTVLALMQMGITDAAYVAALLGVPEKEGAVGNLIRQLRVSRNRVIRHCVRYGLPPGVFRDLPAENARVQCPKCHAMVNSVPCRFCAHPVLRREPAKVVNGCRVARTPTTARPGTPAKVEVMQRRVAEGLSPFHPDDVQLSEAGDEREQ